MREREREERKNTPITTNLAKFEIKNKSNKKLEKKTKIIRERESIEMRTLNNLNSRSKCNWNISLFDANVLQNKRESFRKITLFKWCLDKFCLLIMQEIIYYK